MIAIKNMKMPKNCGKCPLCVNEEFCYNVCVALSTVLDDNTYKKTKHLNCPLIEVEVK